MRKIILVAVLIVLAGIYFQRATVIAVVMERGMDSRMDSNILDSLEDGLHVALCGAGGPMPAPNASGPCVAVVAGDQLFIVDAGTDGVRNLGRMGYQVGDITAVFITHFPLRSHRHPRGDGNHSMGCGIESSTTPRLRSIRC
jgi:ribonuclease Z